MLQNTAKYRSEYINGMSKVNCSRQIVTLFSYPTVFEEDQMH